MRQHIMLTVLNAMRPGATRRSSLTQTHKYSYSRIGKI